MQAQIYSYKYCYLHLFCWQLPNDRLTTDSSSAAVKRETTRRENDFV